MRTFSLTATCLVCGCLLAPGCSGDDGAAPGSPDAALFDAGHETPDLDATDGSTADAAMPDGSAVRGDADGFATDAAVDLATFDVDAAPPVDGGDADAPSGCPPEMVRIGAFCVDRYEAFVVELREDGAEAEHSPFTPVDGLEVRAKSAGGTYPQGYISQAQAARACANAGKRLCDAAEFALACRGDDPAAHYPYPGATRVPGSCNEGKGSPMVRLFGSDATKWTYADLNDARLDQLSDTLAATGSFPACASPYGVYDCVGNLNEWGADPPDANGHAHSRGGSYADSEINGPGCLYVTSAHDPTYHDYSTGFRCCVDAF